MISRKAWSGSQKTIVINRVACPTTASPSLRRRANPPSADLYGENLSVRRTRARGAVPGKVSLGRAAGSGRRASAAPLEKISEKLMRKVSRSLG
jgi:hypothetical protein